MQQCNTGTLNFYPVCASLAVFWGFWLVHAYKHGSDNGSKIGGENAFFFKSDPRPVTRDPATLV